MKAKKRNNMIATSKPTRHAKDARPAGTGGAEQGAEQGTRRPPAPRSPYGFPTAPRSGLPSFPTEPGPPRPHSAPPPRPSHNVGVAGGSPAPHGSAVSPPPGSPASRARTVPEKAAPRGELRGRGGPRTRTTQQSPP